MVGNKDNISELISGRNFPVQTGLGMFVFRLPGLWEWLVRKPTLGNAAYVALGSGEGIILQHSLFYGYAQ